MVVTTMMRLNSNNDDADVTTRNENQNFMEIPRIYKNMSISRKVLQPQNENLQTMENNINSLNFCNCLKNRNMSRGDHKRQEQFKRKYRRKHSLTYPNYYSSDNNSITGTLNSNTINTNLKSYSDCFNPHPLNSFTSITTISVTTLYNNLLQHVVGGAGSGSNSQGWHITTAAASTAITIFATLYYIMANTQGASAVLAVETATSSSSSALSFPITNLTFYPSTSSNNINNSSPLSSNTHLNIGDSGSSGINHHSIHPSSYLDLNYYINSTEITILNSVSSLPTTKASAYRTSSNNNNNIITVTHSTNNNNNNVISFNDSLDDMSAEDASEYIFDRTDVRIIFITLYTMVFCCCFFGNLLVILVVTLSRRLRSITNFFLANLALADFCVGLFCVMQNLSIYLIDSWVFGEFLCRMYQFVHSLSYTASIFILVVICMERYFAIVHPITCKQILTAARLRMVILTVWITSAVYSTPKFVFSKTIKNVHTESGREEEICVLDRKMFNSKLLDMINFGLLYCIPLLVMTILYSKIAIALWRSSRGLQHHLNQQENSMTLHNSMYHHNNHQHQHNHNHNNHHQHLHSHHQQQQQQQLQNTQLQQQQQQLQPTPLGTPISVNSSVVSATTLSRKQSCKYEKRGVSLTESQVSLDADRPVVSTCRKKSFYQHCHNHFTNHQQPQTTAAVSANNSRPNAHTHTLHGSVRVSHISHSSNNVLRARRGVVRMLIIFVLTFALCNLPYHARKMWQYWSRSYRGDSNFNALFTPLTFLVTYFNSGINPLLYAFLSRNFRKGMRELLMCSWRKSKTKSSTNSSMHHKRHTTLQHSLPTDTTHIGNEQL